MRMLKETSWISKIWLCYRWSNTKYTWHPLLNCLDSIPVSSSSNFRLLLDPFVITEMLEITIHVVHRYPGSGATVCDGFRDVHGYGCLYLSEVAEPAQNFARDHHLAPESTKLYSVKRGSLNQSKWVALMLATTRHTFQCNMWDIYIGVCKKRSRISAWCPHNRLRNGQYSTATK